MKKKVILIFLAVIVTIGIYKYRHHTNSKEADSTWVEVAKVAESTLPVKVEVIGTLAARSVEISPEISGHVATIFFTDGAPIKSGDALIQLDDAIYRAKFSSARAKYEYSKNYYARMAFLGKKGAIAKQAIEQAESDLKERKADVDEAEVLLKQMKLTAPFDGVLSKSKVNLGDYVNVGQGLVTLTDTKHLHIEYNIPEKYLSFLKLNQLVSIKTSAYPNEIFRGKVAYIAPTVNTDNRSVSIYAEVPNDNSKLAAGMFVNVTHTLGKEEHILMVPARSIMPILDGEQIYKIVDGKAVAVSVLLGKRSGNDVQILEGIKKGDIIVTDGQLKIKNGMAVKYKTMTI